MAAKTHKPAAKAAHVNMMTDTIITNMPLDGLRTIMRAILASQPQITATFEQESRRYMRHAADAYSNCATESSLEDTKKRQQTIRCMIGCGMCHESLRLLCELVLQAVALLKSELSVGSKNEIHGLLAAIDGDMVQVATAVEKSMLSSAPGIADSLEMASKLHRTLCDLQAPTKDLGIDFPYSRGLGAMAGLLGEKTSTCAPQAANTLSHTPERPTQEPKETVELAGRRLPRIFSGLWQLSSPAWGSAPASEIFNQFSLHVSSGFTAFDMADHYGDAEVLAVSNAFTPIVLPSADIVLPQGQFLASYPSREDIFAATKYCVFHPMTVTREAVRANVAERCRRLQTERIDLLQFHWQFVSRGSSQFVVSLHTGV